MGTHLDLAFAAVGPFPQKESLAAAHAGLLYVSIATSYAEDSELEKQLLLFTPIRTIISDK